jgi:hypothetical protein
MESFADSDNAYSQLFGRERWTELGNAAVAELEFSRADFYDAFFELLWLLNERVHRCTSVRIDDLSVIAFQALPVNTVLTKNEIKTILMTLTIKHFAALAVPALNGTIIGKRHCVDMSFFYRAAPFETGFYVY